MLDLWNNQSMA